MRYYLKTTILSIVMLGFSFGCSRFNGSQLVSCYEEMPIVVKISKIETHQVPREEIGKYNASTITLVKGGLKIINTSSATKMYDIRDIHLSMDGNVSKSGEIDSVIDYLYKGELSPGASLAFPMYWILENELVYKEGMELRIYIFKEFNRLLKN